ncbi:ParA family protein [Nicoliella lavandulae]|uniref:AAA family ATPase n=1 Tax=Nicoliella lavandulae TaxID=3082954 RepID=A0ABU8SMX6_9LACO
MTAKIISFANQKGGVGKTTTTFEVAENLSQQFDKRVLIIDLDPQASLTSIKYDMRKLISEHMDNMTDVMIGKESIQDIIINLKENMDIAPTTLQLSDAELNLVNTTLRELVLSKNISTIKDDYDFILIDCPPSRGLLTVNALSASDYVLIPVQAEYQSLLGMQLLKKTIRDVKSQIKPDLKTLGYAVTMITPTNHAKDAIENIEHDNLDILAEIPRSVDVADASVANMSTYEYRKNNKAGKAYYELSKKINEL